MRRRRRMPNHCRPCPEVAVSSSVLGMSCAQRRRTMAIWASMSAMAANFAGDAGTDGGSWVDVRAVGRQLGSAGC